MDDLELSDETLAAMEASKSKPADFAGVVGQAKMFYTEWRPLPMTAKELHDLYAPLHAAVPETRPRRSYCGDDAPLCFLAGWGWGELAAAEVDEDAAAALCRVAAEDWLQENCPLDYWTFAPGRVPVGRYCVNIVGLSYGEIDESLVYEGPTIHHALVAACMSVHANSSPTSAPSPQLPHPPA